MRRFFARSSRAFASLLALAAIPLAIGRAQPARVASRRRAEAAAAQPTDWPRVTRFARPWTRWWWMGSAVDSAGLTAALEAYRGAGLGGVELTPVYGVRGQEDRFIDYLSPRWVAMLEHTLDEASRLDLGVDLANATGWPFGGPWVRPSDASKLVLYRTYALDGGERLRDTIHLQQEPLVRMQGGGTPPVSITSLHDPIASNAHLDTLAIDQVRFPRDLPLQALVAYSSTGAVLDLTPRVSRQRVLDWTAPPGRWTLYAVFQGWHGKQVERGAPGGEGDVIDHFSTTALRDYLARFDTAFAGGRVSRVRAFFNDSYEVDDARGQADWTPRLFDEFRGRRGYDLRAHLPALFGRGPADERSRVLTDYRETMADLLRDDFTAPWRTWAHRRGAAVRDQAHGSPGNILDLYAASDIPETEGIDLVRMKFATSAAHVAGKPLASSESATWLDEHFLATLADVKTALNRYFAAGVNHVFYHGTAYSPADAPWPGWLFYAAVHFQPTNTWWRDFGALNEYIARLQSFLQQGTPSEDVLLYFPFADRLADASGPLLEHFDGVGAPSNGAAFQALAELLETRGVAADFISDRQLASVFGRGGELTVGGVQYRALVVPPTTYMPLATARHLVALARAGATIIFQDRVPADVPGFAAAARRRASLRRAFATLHFADVVAASGAGEATIREARIGRGRVLVGDDVETMLVRAGVRRERMVDSGVRFARRRVPRGVVYFVVDTTDQPLEGWFPLATPARAAVVFDPARGERGVATTRRSGDAVEVFLQLRPGDGVIMRTYDTPVAGEPMRYASASAASVAIAGPWAIDFVTGGPTLPARMTVDHLGSWTEPGGEDVTRFSGTARYTATFAHPAVDSGAAAAGTPDAWILDLGRVCESARVRVNGREVGTLLGPTFRLVLDGAALGATNTLEVDVTNLMANRVADLDRRHASWKDYYNVGFAAHRASDRDSHGQFDASRWSPRCSGLVGPVTLSPARWTRP